MLDYKALEDCVLLDKLYLNKDATAFSALYERYSILIYGVCLHKTKDTVFVEDLMMDTFEDFYKAAISGKIQRVDKWLYSVASNNSLSFLSKKGLESSFIEAEQERIEKEMTSSNENDGFLHLHHPEKDPLQLQTYIKEALSAIKEEHRICLSLFYIDEMSYREIAEQTQYSVAAVKSHIQNGKRNLGNILKEKMAHLL